MSVAQRVKVQLVPSAKAFSVTMATELDFLGNALFCETLLMSTVYTGYPLYPRQVDGYLIYVKTMPVTVDIPSRQLPY